MTHALRTTILSCDNLSSVKVSPMGTDWVIYPCGCCLWLVMDMVIHTQVAAPAVHICGASPGHRTAWLCLAGKMLEQIITVLLRDLWAKPCSKEQKWQVWYQVKPKAGKPHWKWVEQKSKAYQRKSCFMARLYLTRLKDHPLIGTDGTRLFPPLLTKHWLCLIWKDLAQRWKFPWLLCRNREGDFPPTLSRNDDHPAAPQDLTRGHYDNQKLFPHSSLYAGPLKLQGTACSLSSAPGRASQPVCHRLPDTRENLFSLLVQGRGESGKPWTQLQNLAVTWLGRMLSTMRV